MLVWFYSQPFSGCSLLRPVLLLAEWLCWVKKLWLIRQTWVFVIGTFLMTCCLNCEHYVCVCVCCWLGFFAVFLFVYCRLMTLTLSVCVAGKRVQETICLGGSVVLIVFNFCCLLIYFESCYVYSIVAAACKSLIQCHHSLTSWLYIRFTSLQPSD